MPGTNTNPKRLTRQQLLEDLFQAYFDARRTKRNTTNQLLFEMNFESNLSELCDHIYNQTYTIGAYTCFIIHNPIKREVFAAQFRDRVVHHLVFNYLSPLFESTFIQDSYSCRKDKGTLYGIQRLRHHARSCSNNFLSPSYILKLDIQGYFMNINRQKLFNTVKSQMDNMAYRKARGQKQWVELLDYTLLEYLLKQIIFTNPTTNCIINGSMDDWQGLPPSKSLFHSPVGCGLPIGNLTSQLFSNIYLNAFDNYCKRELGLKHYGRYVDDFYIIHQSQSKLRELVPVLAHKLKTDFSLTLHPRKIVLQEVSKGIKFLGVISKGHNLLIGQRSKTGLIKCIHRLSLNPDEPLSAINSYLGLVKHCNTYHLRTKLLRRTSLPTNADFTKIITIHNYDKKEDE